MGLRGPPPKPTALKLAAGNPGRRPINSAEPQPPPGAPDPPAFVKGRSREIWDDLVPRLAPIGLARSVDGLALGRYCALFARWERLNAFLEQHGTTFAIRAENPNGKQGRVLNIKAAPQTQQAATIEQKLIALEREFGLTPASRTRIRTDTERKLKQDPDQARRSFFASA